MRAETNLNLFNAELSNHLVQLIRIAVYTQSEESTY